MRTWLCLLAFCVSFGYALAYRIVPSVDARKFNDIAINLVTKHTFCFECNVPLAQDTAIRDIGPGYQFFLAGIYEIFGIHIWIIWFLQAIMQAVVVAWIWRLMDSALRGLDERPWMRAIPLGLYAVHPDIVQNNAMLMADGLFTFLFVGCIMVFLPYLEAHPPKGWKRPVALGTLIGLLTMVKPTGLPLLILILAVLAWKRIWKAILIMVCCFVLVQVPWAIRNAMTYDHFVYNSVVGGLDMWVGLYPQSNGTFDLDNLPDITKQIQGIPPDQLDSYSAAQTKQIIMEHPVFAIERTTQKFFQLFALSKTSGFWFHYHGVVDQGMTVVLSALFNLVLLGLGFAAFVYAGMKKIFDRPVLWVCLAAITLLAVSPTLTVVVNRYRIPMLPFFTVLSAYWLAAARTRKDRVISLTSALAFLAVCTGVDLWGSLQK